MDSDSSIKPGETSRRDIMIGGLGLATATGAVAFAGLIPAEALAGRGKVNDPNISDLVTNHGDEAPASMPRAASAPASLETGSSDDGFLITADKVRIYYKDWGPKNAPTMMFHHGWPLTADDWDPQMLFFLDRGFRVIAHDRRGHGRSTQTATGNDMAHYAADIDALVSALGLKNVIHVGHSTGGGEVAAYLGQYGTKHASKAVLISAVTPLLVNGPSNPAGLPLAVFDKFRAAVASNRAEFYRQLPILFYGFNREGSAISEGLKENWWRQAMSGGLKAQYDSIRAFSETDLTAHLRRIDIPVLMLHGDDDQVVPLAATSQQSIRLLPKASLKIYRGFSHGMCSVNADIINADLLSFAVS